MNKKFAILIIILILLLIAGGVFWWWSTKEEEPDVGFVRFEEFEIQETENGRIIKHNEFGFCCDIGRSQN